MSWPSRSTPGLSAYGGSLALVAGLVVSKPLGLSAWATRGRHCIARTSPPPEGGVYQRYQMQRCVLCERDYEGPNMAHCPACQGATCSLGCTLDARRGDRWPPMARRHCSVRPRPGPARHRAARRHDARHGWLRGGAPAQGIGSDRPHSDHLHDRSNRHRIPGHSLCGRRRRLCHQTHQAQGGAAAGQLQALGANPTFTKLFVPDLVLEWLDKSQADARAQIEPPRLSVAKGSRRLTFRLHQQTGDDANEGQQDGDWLIIMRGSTTRP